MLTIQLISSEKGNGNINNIKVLILFDLSGGPKGPSKRLQASLEPSHTFTWPLTSYDGIEVLSNMGQIRAFLRPVFESYRQPLHLPGAPTGTAFALCWLLQYTEL